MYIIHHLRYSRKILWLNISNSNNDPKIIAHHFLICVKTLGGCPRVLRTDLGTENAVIAYLQPTLRHFHADSLSGINSHRYGKSTANQRIECLWAQLRRSLLEWWISFFKVTNANKLNNLQSVGNGIQWTLQSIYRLSQVYTCITFLT
jgi:hypothetical protein